MCNSNKNKDCNEASSGDCQDGEQYCAAVGVPSFPAYFKGCVNDANLCDTKDSNGKKAYTKCNVCDSDECNDDQF